MYNDKKLNVIIVIELKKCDINVEKLFKNNTKTNNNKYDNDIQKLNDIVVICRLKSKIFNRLARILNKLIIKIIFKNEYKNKTEGIALYKFFWILSKFKLKIIERFKAILSNSLKKSIPSKFPNPKVTIISKRSDIQNNIIVIFLKFWLFLKSIPKINPIIKCGKIKKVALIIFNNITAKI